MKEDLFRSFTVSQPRPRMNIKINGFEKLNRETFFQRNYPWIIALAVSIPWTIMIMAIRIIFR